MDLLCFGNNTFCLHWIWIVHGRSQQRKFYIQYQKYFFPGWHVVEIKNPYRLNQFLRYTLVAGLHSNTFFMGNKMVLKIQQLEFTETAYRH